jgi:hypothetical protein
MGARRRLVKTNDGERTRMDQIGHVRLYGDGMDVGNGRGEDNVTSTLCDLMA